MNSGNFFSVATAAFIMNGSMLILTPDFSSSLFICTRNCSRSVMSASSCVVPAASEQLPPKPGRQDVEDSAER